MGCAKNEDCGGKNATATPTLVSRRTAPNMVRIAYTPDPTVHADGKLLRVRGKSNQNYGLRVPGQEFNVLKRDQAAEPERFPIAPTETATIEVGQGLPVGGLAPTDPPPNDGAERDERE